MRRPSFGLLLTACLLLAAPLPALADDVDCDAPRIVSVQPRAYHLGHELALGLGVQPLDAFYVGLVVDGSYTYHFTDFWAWEIAGASYSFNFGTGLESDLLDTYGVEPVGGAQRMRLLGRSDLVVKPLYGKLGLFNRTVIFAETQFSAGVGPALMGDTWRPSFNYGATLRLWVVHAVSLRLDLRHQMVFAHAAPDHALLLVVGVGFNVGGQQEVEP